MSDSSKSEENPIESSLLELIDSHEPITMEHIQELEASMDLHGLSLDTETCHDEPAHLSTKDDIESHNKLFPGD